ncbi:hypothetical protein [Spirosoma sp. KUDC1026]|uniref:hypothetical protein n=1 Tax=Spirosoma sp. KUDC1026 TaxID=2745947 RepID=UPI00159BA3E8|nr:hypothetical protein [Spirosoma sp. KUDC1026]QKZ13545.1 hypothetical protein HU175_13240 [Spirosoma sp. KUDC1026]
MLRPFLLLALFAALLAACSTGKTALNHGHFDLAVKRASYRLQQPKGIGKRGYTLAPWVLQQAFIRAYEQHQTTIRQLSSPANTAPFRWESVYQAYEKLQALTDDAHKANQALDRRVLTVCDSCPNWLTAYPLSYQDRQRDTRELAAADRYEAAEQAFAYREQDRLAAKDAYLNYKKALDWVPDYRQAKAKSEDAFPFAILRVVVEPLGPTRDISQSDNQRLSEKILDRLGHSEAPSTFVRLYPPTESAGDGFPIHQAIQMQVTDYDAYDERTSSSSTTVYSTQEYKVGEKKINDSTKVDILEKAKGTLTTHRREIRAGLDLRMRAVDTQTGQTLWEEPIWESRTWQTEWETFSGDDRALNGYSLKSANLFPPSRWSLYTDMRDELVGDVVRRLRVRYSQD